MPAKSSGHSPVPRPDFTALLREITAARANLVHVRTSPKDRLLVSGAQQELRIALEAYAAGATSAGITVPHRLQIELNTYRGLKPSRGPQS